MMSSLSDSIQPEDIPEGLPPDVYYRWKANQDIHNEEYSAKLCDIRQRLVEAAHLCQYLELNITPASTKEVTMYKTVLSAAMHKAEELYADITTDYPIPNNAAASVSEDCALPHEKYLPKMCYQDSEAAVIYLPQQRTRRNAKSLPISLHIAEFRDFILAANFPTLTDWQADFIHVFHPDDAEYCRDVDNYEYKKYIDLIARKMGVKDSGRHFSLAMHNEFTTAIAPGTYIIIQQRISLLPEILSCFAEK